jgi:predicted nucleotidyltransferase
MTVHIINFDAIFSEERLDYITQRVAEEARTVFGNTLREVILYGSYARGDHKHWSDVDIMILADIDDLTAKKLDRELAKRLSNLDCRMNMLLSIIVVPFSRFKYFNEYYPFYMNVRKEGVRIC